MIDYIEEVKLQVFSSQKTGFRMPIDVYANSVCANYSNNLIQWGIIRPPLNPRAKQVCLFSVGDGEYLLI